MSAINTLLIPIEELPPGSLGAIRRQVTDNLIQIVSTQLKVSPNTLVSRDLRCFTDLAWGTGANYATTAATKDIWEVTTDGSLTAYQEMITTASTNMADQRWVAIYGLRDMKSCFATKVTQATSLIKFIVGNSVKAIWDTSKLLCYKNNPVGVCPSAIIIPQNTQYQIEGYILTASTVCWISLEGVIVEPRGKVISP